MKNVVFQAFIRFQYGSERFLRLSYLCGSEATVALYLLVVPVENVGCRLLLRSLSSGSSSPICQDCRRHPDSTVSLSTGRPSNSLLSVLRDNSLFLKTIKRKFNPLIAALKPQSNGPSYSVYSDWYTGR